MHFFKNLFLALLVSAALILSVHSKHHPLSRFGKKVKSTISKDDCEKVFAVNFKTADDLIEANHKANHVFEEMIGKIDEKLLKKFDEEVIRLQHIVTPSLLFHEYTNAIPKTLKEIGKLNKENCEKLVHEYVAELEKAAEMKNDGKITSSFPILTAANCKFFQSLGLAGNNEFVDKYNKNLLHELEQY